MFWLSFLLWNLLSHLNKHLNCMMKLYIFSKVFCVWSKFFFLKFQLWSLPKLRTGFCLKEILQMIPRHWRVLSLNSCSLHAVILAKCVCMKGRHVYVRACEWVFERLKWGEEFRSCVPCSYTQTYFVRSLDSWFLLFFLNSKDQTDLPAFYVLCVHCLGPCLP